MFMSETQKKAIRDILLKTFTIGTTSFSASCVYENQIVPDGRDSAPLLSNMTYPAIVLKYTDTEQKIKDIHTVGMNMTELNINLYAEAIDERPSGDYINGKVAVDGMTKQLLENLNTNYENLFAYGIYIDEQIEGVNIRDLSTIATRKHVYRNKFTLSITYEV